MIVFLFCSLSDNFFFLSHFHVKPFFISFVVRNRSKRHGCERGKSVCVNECVNVCVGVNECVNECVNVCVCVSVCVWV